MLMSTISDTRTRTIDVREFSKVVKRRVVLLMNPVSRRLYMCIPIYNMHPENECGVARHSWHIAFLLHARVNTTHLSCERCYVPALAYLCYNLPCSAYQSNIFRPCLILCLIGQWLDSICFSPCRFSVPLRNLANEAGVILIIDPRYDR